MQVVSRKTVEYAQKANWPYALVLEDNVWPRANVRQKLEECLKTLHDNNIKIAAFLLNAVIF